MAQLLSTIVEIRVDQVDGFLRPRTAVDGSKGAQGPQHVILTLCRDFVEDWDPAESCPDLHLRVQHIQVQLRMR